MNALPSNVQIPKLTRSGAFYMLLPVLLLGTGVLGWIVMVRAALGDPSAAIEPDYYNQATNTDHQKEILARSAELGWTAQVESFGPGPAGNGAIVLRMVDREARGLDGLDVNIIAFPNARAADRQSIPLGALEPGRYAAPVARARLGIWEIRVVARRGSDEFHTTLRHEVLSPRTSE